MQPSWPLRQDPLGIPSRFHSPELKFMCVWERKKLCSKLKTGQKRQTCFVLHVSRPQHKCESPRKRAMRPARWCIFVEVTSRTPMGDVTSRRTAAESPLTGRTWSPPRSWSAKIYVGRHGVVAGNLLRSTFSCPLTLSSPLFRAILSLHTGRLQRKWHCLTGWTGFWVLR